MKVCIVGAGAIGGLIAARIAQSGAAQVSLLARGATLQALRERGLALKSGGTTTTTKLVAADRASELGAQDLIVIAVKGPALTAAADALGPLLAPDTVVMPAMNGVPWWFCADVPGFGATPLESVDPGGRIARAIPLHHVLGCVVHMSASVAQPASIEHRIGQGLIVGEPAGGRSERAQRVVDLLTRAGFDATQAADVRFDIWYKLWGNLTMNPVSALTGATVERILSDPQVRALCSAAMQEAARIGERIGCRVTQSPEERHAVTARLGAFKTSMLQDVEAGRPIELDAIVGAVHEIGARVGEPTPMIDALLGLARLFARTRGLYPQAGGPPAGS